MDALELLTADHNRVRGLFARFKKADEGNDTATMTECAGKIVEDLTVHTTIEEEIFYPTIRDASEDIKDLVDEGFEEHRVAKTLIEELGTVELGADEWVAKMKVLIENVEHHAEEEETQMFPAVRSRTEVESRAALGARLESRKRELGAPTVADAIDLPMEELKAKAKEQQIPGRSKMDKEHLAATIDPR